MTAEKLEIVHGSGNIFADFNDPDAETRQMKAFIAAEIIKIVNHRKLTVRDAAEVTGMAAADISRIRNADLARFTIDRLVRALARLDRRLTLTVRKIRKAEPAAMSQ